MIKLLTLFAPRNGQGMGGHTGRSWGGCTVETKNHHCKGHVQDQPSWQHTCPCGFRWAGTPKEIS